MPSASPAWPAARSAETAGSRSSNSSTKASGTWARAEARRSAAVSPGSASTSAAMRSKNCAWRASSRRCRKNTHAIRLSWEASVAFLAASAYGAICSATAPSPTSKPASTFSRRVRRSAGSSAHSRTSRGRATAVGSHCRRATSRGKKAGPKLPFLRAKGPATTRSQGSWSAMAPRYQPRGVDPRAPGRAAFEQLHQAHGVTPADHPGLELRALEQCGQVRIDAGGPPGAAQRGELRHAQVRQGLLARRPVREEAVNLLDQNQATRADLISHPGSDRVGGHLPRRGQRVEWEAGGKEDHGLRSGELARPREVGAAHGTRDELAEQ